MSEHVFPVRAGLPPHMVVKLGWNGYSKSYFMAYLDDGSGIAHPSIGGLMHVGHDPAELCLAARSYTAAIPANFARQLEADRQAEESDGKARSSIAPVGADRRYGALPNALGAGPDVRGVAADVDAVPDGPANMSFRQRLLAFVWR